MLYFCTSSCFLGLVGLELLKTLDYKDRNLVDFKNAFINLSTPLILLSEPMAPLQSKDKDYDPIAGGPVKARPSGFTSWDFLEFAIRKPLQLFIWRLMCIRINVC